MLNTEQLTQVVIRSVELQRLNYGYRVGQALFNALEDLHPDEANRVRGTESDPFYNDSKIDSFFQTLSQ
jgi:hypothetical protein